MYIFANDLTFLKSKIQFKKLKIIFPPFNLVIKFSDAIDILHDVVLNCPFEKQNKCILKTELMI